MTHSNQPRTTGRSIVLLRENAVNEGVRTLASTTRTRGTDDIVSFENLGVAVVDVPPEELADASGDDSPILAVEPERYVYALGEPTSKMTAARSVTSQAEFDESHVTWGLQATGVANLKPNVDGSGIRVAILDTGIDFKHPDFQGRSIVSKSFIDGEEVQDGDSHGTHCAGTSCGSNKPSQLPRYGIAYNASLYVGKVLANDGSGSDSSVLQGIEWAIANRCDIISMSLGGSVEPGEPFSQVYETVAKRALNRGTLIIAAAGNSSDRNNGIRNPVNSPANCPSIMAVAALDSQLQVAYFSDAGINPDGGHVDIAGPGVDVYSSVPLLGKYDRFNGTSMATPHVAGIAALYAQVTGLRGRELWWILTQNAQRLDLFTSDVGIGLVQAPK
ncbi:S8 family serine peptidase [Scytonema sp. UIC 10036]|uniref:S8 family peptidase n=1 Tax=Scytonema sp. UIC 10036 TaxID=2304196 RepID=UPI0012DAF0C9|nr:S8 family serine peptidase [Scytonema sp. UIC 10036]MUG98303.1 S8 family serine peptidase [Scytonema sp. UIC 10036]